MFKFVDTVLKKYHQTKFLSPEEEIANAIRNNQREKVLATSNDIVSKIINERYTVASQIKPVKHSIEIISNLCNSTPVELKDLNENIVECPVEQLFNDNISLLHQSFRDFKISFQREMQINGIVYLLMKLDGNNIVSLDIVPTNYITIQNTNSFRGVITRYTITNFLNIIGQKIFDLDAENSYYITQDQEYILFATNIGFEKQDLNLSNINLIFSPLISIAMEAESYRNAMIRLNALNTKGMSGGLLDVQIATADIDKITEIKNDLVDNLKGTTNNGNVKILVRQANPLSNSGGMTSTYIPIGNTANDYNLSNDIEFTESSIYESYGISTSYAKQDAKYVGNQAESLRQLYNGKIFIEVQQMYEYLKRWLFPFLNMIPNEYKYVVNNSKIDVFMQNQVTFIQAVGDILKKNEKRALLHYDPIEEITDNNIEKTEIKKAINFFKTNVD